MFYLKQFDLKKNKNITNQQKRHSIYFTNQIAKEGNQEIWLNEAQLLILWVLPEPVNVGKHPVKLNLPDGSKSLRAATDLTAWYKAWDIPLWKGIQP